MKRQKKLIIAILFVILIGIIILTLGQIYFGGEDLSTGDRNILVLAIDESEPRPGMGAVDMAFLVHLTDGGIENYTPIYPHGLRHPTVAEPEEYQAMGAGAMLLLHDSFYWDNDQQDLIYAKEIVESNTNYSIDAVVAVNSEAVDNVISSAGQLTVNGSKINASGIDLIRESQYEGGETRGDAVMKLSKALIKASKDPTKRNSMVQTAIQEYSNGNIAMYPQGSFMKLLASKGVKAVMS